MWPATPIGPVAPVMSHNAGSGPLPVIGPTASIALRSARVLHDAGSRR